MILSISNWIRQIANAPSDCESPPEKRHENKFREPRLLMSAANSMSLTKKLVLAFLLVTLIPLGVIIWVSHQTFVDQAQEQIGTRLEDSAVEVGRSIDEFMLSCLRDTKFLAADPDLSSGDHSSETNIYPVSSTPFPISIRPCWWTPRAGSLPPPTARAWASRCSPISITPGMSLSRRSRPAGFGVYHRPGDVSEPPPRRCRRPCEQPLLNIQMLAPVQDGSGRCVGVLVANVVTRQMLDLLQDLKQRAPGDEFPCLLDKDGRVLMSTDPQARLLSQHADVTKRSVAGSIEQPR